MLPAARLYVGRMKRFTHRIRQSDSEIQSVIQESLQHRSVVQTLEQNSHHVDRLDTLQRELVRQVDDRMRFSLLARTVVAAIFRVVISLLSFGELIVFRMATSPLVHLPLSCS